MTVLLLARLFEHNDWANDVLVAFCAGLEEATLDAHPRSEREWTVREVLVHLAEAQADYVALITVPQDERAQRSVAFAELAPSLAASGQALAALARDGAGEATDTTLCASDGYTSAPWVVLLQALQHAIEHRRQVCSLLRALGRTPPDLDGWSYGLEVGALVPPPKTD